MDQEPTLWGIHAGRTGDADSLFLKKSVIAIGWGGMGDLVKLPPTREAFKAHYITTYSEEARSKPGAVPNSAGQLFRFVHEIRIGDFVVYPSKISKLINLGRVTGGYVFDPANEDSYPNQRSVDWLRQIPRTHFSQGALYETGSALSLFTVKNYADEFWTAIEGQQTQVISSVEKDDSVAEIAQDVEETTRDFVIKVLAQETKGHPFTDFVANLLQTMGYRTRVSPEGPDGGIDIVAHKDELGFEPPIIKVQCKSSEGSIGDPVISSLYGKVGQTEFGLFVTLGTFTSQAIRFAQSRSNLRLIDGDQLVELILAHYEQLDSKYKGIIPLKKVYIP